MMNFIYDSLETIKNIKHPSWKEIINLTISVFVLVIISWIIFMIASWLFTDLYKILYHTIRG